MKIVFLTIGKTTQAFIREAVALYEKRLDRYVKYERVELPDIKNGAFPVETIKKREGELILKYVKDSDRLILLDEKGKSFTSGQFASYLNQLIVTGTKTAIFAIGGAYGFSDEVYARANDKISLSSMTFSHQLVRVIWSEQIYRAFTIINGEPYHHE